MHKIKKERERQRKRERGCNPYNEAQIFMDGHWINGQKDVRPDHNYRNSFPFSTDVNYIPKDRF